MAAGSERDLIDDATLWIGNLDPETTTSQLLALCSRFGVVQEVHFIGGCGLVKFSSRLEAEQAKSNLHRKRLHLRSTGSKRDMMVHWAMAEPMLWVGDLGSDVRSDDLRTAFLQFGELREAKVVADPVSGASRGYGFVTFHRRFVAGVVLDVLAENLFLIGSSCRPVRAAVALDRSRGDDPAGPTGVQSRKLSTGTTPNHFAQPGSLEFEFAKEWRELLHRQDLERATLRARQVREMESLAEKQREEFERQMSRLGRASAVLRTIEERSRGSFGASAAGPARFSDVGLGRGTSGGGGGGGGGSEGSEGSVGRVAAGSAPSPLESSPGASPGYGAGLGRSTPSAIGEARWDASAADAFAGDGDDASFAGGVGTTGGGTGGGGLGGGWASSRAGWSSKPSPSGSPATGGVRSSGWGVEDDSLDRRA